MCIFRPTNIAVQGRGLLLALVLALPAPVLAADLATRKGPAASAAEAEAPGVPGDDIFGFTNVTDPGNPGDLQVFNENDGRLGKRDGSYSALNQKLAVGYTFAQNWWFGFGVFSALNKMSGVTGLGDTNHGKFDGASVELLHRVVERSASNPFAVTVSVEPRWGRVDGVSGQSAESFASTFKLFVDAPVVADKLFWGANIQLNVQNSQDPTNTSQWLPSSQVALSTALAWQPASPNFFLGVEARYFVVSDNFTFSHDIGHALYLGPTLLWKPTDKLAFNVTYQPQVYGRAAANPGLRLDLDNFERAQFRAKLNVAF